VKCQLSGGEGRGGGGEPIKLSNSSKQIIPDQKKRGKYLPGKDAPEH